MDDSQPFPEIRAIVPICQVCRGERDERYVPCSVGCPSICEQCLSGLTKDQSEAQHPPSRPMECPVCVSANQARRERSAAVLRRMNIVSRVLNTTQHIINYVAYWIILGILGLVTYLFMTIYGAYIFRSFIGHEAFNRTLDNDFTQWPLIAWINLPMIPPSLFIRQSRYAIFCVVFMWAQAIIFVLFGHSEGIASFPPTPLALFLAFPPGAMAYTVALNSTTKWLLGTSSNQRNGDSTARQEDEDSLGVKPASGANSGFSSHPAIILGQLISKALICHFITFIIGNALLVLSRYSPLLRYYLGIETTRSFSPLTMLHFVGSRMFRAQNQGYIGLDAVWWRNSIALALFVISYDAFWTFKMKLELTEQSTQTLDSTVETPNPDVSYPNLIRRTQAMTMSHSIRQLNTSVPPTSTDQGATTGEMGAEMGHGAVPDMESETDQPRGLAPRYSFHVRRSRNNREGTL